MTADTRVGRTFRVRPVLASIGSVVESHYRPARRARGRPALRRVAIRGRAAEISTLPDGDAASPGVALAGWGLTIVGTTVAAAVFPVCYYHLRNAGASPATPGESAELPA